MLLLSPYFAHSANFDLVESSHCQIKLSGTIYQNDLDLLEKYDGNYYSICLDSPGGNFIEAIEIATYLKKKGIETVIDSGDSCISACAIIFMAGSIYDEVGYGVRRKLNADGVLGFHAPYIETRGATARNTEVSALFSAALKIVSKLLDISKLLKIDNGLISELLTYGPNEYYYVDTVDKAGRWGIDVILDNNMMRIPVSEVTNDMFRNMCLNVFHWNSNIYDVEDLECGECIPDTAAEETFERKIENDYHIVTYSNTHSFIGICNIRALEEDGYFIRISTGDDGINYVWGDSYDSHERLYFLFDGDTKLSGLQERFGRQESSKQVTRPKNGFKKFGSYDLFSDDLVKPGRSSFQECHASCKNNEECMGFTYDRWNKFCILKRKIGSKVKLLVQSKSDTYIKLADLSRINFSDGPISFVTRKGKGFFDAPLTTRSHIRFENCEAYCKDSKLCHAFNYVRDGGRCELFTHPSEYRSRPGYMIGLKQQLR